MASTDRRGAPPVPPVHRSRSRFWWAHPRLVQVLALLAIGWGGAYLVWRIGWSGRGTPVALYAVLLAAEIAVRGHASGNAGARGLR